MKAGKTNKTHPELLEGEVFLTNASSDRRTIVTGDHSDDRSDWELIGWQTKRRGLIAYNIHGMQINGLFPIFVQRKELLEAGINPDTLRD